MENIWEQIDATHFPAIIESVITAVFFFLHESIRPLEHNIEGERV